MEDPQTASVLSIPKDLPLKEKLERLKQLNRYRFDYVMQRAQTRTIEQALGRCGLTKGWYYGFDEQERLWLEGLADSLHYEQAIAAYFVIIDNALEAAKVKASGLSSNNERIRQEAATEILDRSMGKPTQPFTGDATVAVQVQVVEVIKSNE